VVASEGLEIGLAHLSPEFQESTSGRARSVQCSASTELATSTPGASDAAFDALLRKLAGLSEARTVVPRAAQSDAVFADASKKPQSAARRALRSGR
jgi:hypothetical protein